MSPNLMKRVAKPMLFSAALIWGVSFVFMKNALDAIPPGHLIAIRFTVGTVLLGLLCGRRWRQFTPDYLWRGGVAGVLLGLTYIVQTMGLALTTPSKSAFLTSLYCVLVPFLAWAVVKQRPDRYDLAAALLCVVGVGLVSLNEQLTIGSGDLLTLLSAVFCAGNLIAISRLGQGKDVMLLTEVQFGTVALCAWALGLCTEQFSFRVLADPAMLWPMFYLCVLATVLCLVLQNIGLVWTEPSVAAVLLSLESVFGVIFAVILYGDPVTARLLTGFALIFLGVLCSETKFSFLRKKKSEAAS